MRRTVTILSLAAALATGISGVGAQNTGYRADISLESLNIEAPGVNPQASQVIVRTKTNCTIVIVVQNKSDRILEGYQLQVTCGGRPVGSEAQGSIRAGESKTHRIRFSPDQPGNFAVDAQIIPKAGALGTGEDNPRNNRASIGLVVEGPGASGTAPSGNTSGGPADLVLDGVSPNFVSALDKYVLEIRIGNKGGSDISSPVELDVEAAGQKFRARTTTGIPAGRTGFATVEVLKERWQRNPHGTVNIDPSHSLKESNVANNKGTF